MENLSSQIGEAVIKNVTFPGVIGNASYTVIDLMHNVKLESLDSMYQALMKQMKSSSTDSLSASSLSNTRKVSALQYRIDLIKAIYTWRVEESDRKAKSKQLAAAKKAKLEILKKVKSEKEMESITQMSLEDIEKQINSFSTD